MRWYRRDDLDDEPSLSPVARVERVRELVDSLDGLERHFVERVYFGGTTVSAAGLEVRVPPKRAAKLLAAGLDRLRGLMLEDDEMGSLYPALMGSVGDRDVSEPRDLAAERREA